MLIAFKYPRVLLRTNIVPTSWFKFPGLRDRTYDLILTRIPTPIPDDAAVSDLTPVCAENIVRIDLVAESRNVTRQ